MVNSASIRHVRGALKHLGKACPLEKIRALCPDLTENQVFLAIDEMSRSGQVRLTRDGKGAYLVESKHGVARIRSCRHARLISDVLTDTGEKTGQVLCLECFARFSVPSCTQMH